MVGKKEGETDLVLWEKSARTVWHVEVGPGKRSIAEDARTFAGAFPGLTVVEAGGSVILSGPVTTSQDKTVLEAYARAHPGVHLRLSLPEEKKTLLLYDLKIIEISRGRRHNWASAGRTRSRQRERSPLEQETRGRSKWARTSRRD